MIPNRPCLRVAGALLFLLLLLPISGIADEAADFAVIGDTHVGYNESVYKTFLTQIGLEKVKTFIVVGDAIYHPGSEAEWKQFFQLAGTDKAVYIAPGNHDFNNYKGLRVYRKEVNQSPYYAFSVDDTQFIILCSVMPNDLYKISGRQFEWLGSELEKPFKHRIVFVHMPLFPTPRGQGYCLDKHKEKRDALHDLFVKHGVKLVFQGHEHLYNRSEKDGITYIITGGGGAHLLSSREEYGGYYHYVLAKKIEEGYVFTVYSLQNNTKKDEFFLK